LDKDPGFVVPVAARVVDVSDFSGGRPLGSHHPTAASEIGPKFRLELRHSGYVNIVNIVKGDTHLVSITIRGVMPRSLVFSKVSLQYAGAR
jgi:hypothetical protein